MNILEQRLTSDKIDVCAIATVGAVCVLMSAVLPDMWDFAALSAGVVNLLWAHRVYSKSGQEKPNSRGWRWN